MRRINMTKTMRLMALGLSVVVFTGCSAVDDLIDEYTDDQEEEFQGHQDGGDTNSGGTNPGNVATGIAYYIDSAVSGVNYKCGSREGITGDNGSFTFEVGSSCTFYLGDMKLRDVNAGLLVNGENVYETDVKIARILQSLDSDGDPKNGITIEAATVQALADEDITLLPTSEADMDKMLAVIAANNTEGKTFSEEEAQDHLDETQGEAAAENVVFNLPSTYYMVEEDSYWNGQEEVREIEAEVMNITEATFSFAEYIFNGDTFIADEEDDDRVEYHFTNGQWVSEDTNGLAVSLSEDKKVMVLDGKHQLTFTSVRNLEGTEVTIQDSTVKATMPAGAELITWEHKVLEDDYGIDEKAYNYVDMNNEYYASLQEVIESQCGSRYFDGVEKEGVDIDGIAFDCNDAGETSGNLIGVKRDSSDFVAGVGTWEIVTLPNSDVQAIVTHIEAAYNEHGDSPLYAMNDGEVWRGWYNKAGTTEEMTMYNKVAYDAFEAKLKSLSGGSATPTPIAPTPTDLATLLAGKTVYTTIWDEMGTLESSTFNADMTSVTWQEMVGGSDTGTEALSVNGMTMTFSDGSETSTVVVTEILEDYMLVTMNGGNAQRLYFDQSKARAYFLGDESFNADFEAILKGTTLYQVWYGTGTDTNGNDIDNVAVVAKVTFNLDGTAEYVGLMNEGTGSGKWEVSNGKLVLVASADSFDYTEYNQYVSGDIASGCIQTNWINENNPNDNNIDLFFTDKTVALNYANTLTSTAHCP